MIWLVVVVGAALLLIGFVLINEDVDWGIVPLLVGLAILIVVIVISTIVGFPNAELRPVCKDYCIDNGMTYDSIKTEGDESYCICDNSLESHLIIIKEKMITIGKEEGCIQ